MEKLALCRICLSVNVDSRSIINNELQEIYQKLTCLAFKTEDRRPLLVCYICISLLRKALALKLDSLAAEHLFSQILDREDQSIVNIPVNTYFAKSHHIKSVSLQPISINTTYEDVISQVAGSDTDKIKRELIDENDPLSECEDNDDFLAPIDLKSLKEDVKEESGYNKHEVLSHTNKLAENDVNALFTERRSDPTKLDLNYTEPYSDSYQESGDLESYKSKECKCHLCPKSFRFLSALKRHILRHTGEKPFKCPRCDRKFAENSNMLKHFRNQHPEATAFTCHKCHNKFDNKASLKQHFRVHINEAYTCDICEKGFKRKWELKEHLLTHGKKPYMCDVCQKCYKNRNFLETHIRIAHTEEKRHKCDKCNLAFKQYHQLKVHRYTHTGKKPFICDMCEKDFAYKTVLINHMKTHTGEKPFKCDQCWKAFRQLSQLMTHFRIHSGERPFKCKTCTKSFIQQTDLTKHIRIHTGERPYKCDVCGRAFAQSYPWVVHMRSHTGEKPYPCNFCQKRFSSHGRLKKHNVVHTGEKPYSCHICEREFCAKSTLRRHMRRIHDTEVKQYGPKNVPTVNRPD